MKRSDCFICLESTKTENVEGFYLCKSCLDYVKQERDKIPSLTIKKLDNIYWENLRGYPRGTRLRPPIYEEWHSSVYGGGMTDEESEESMDEVIGTCLLCESADLRYSAYKIDNGYIVKCYSCKSIYYGRKKETVLFAANCS